MSSKSNKPIDLKKELFKESNNPPDKRVDYSDEIYEGKYGYYRKKVDRSFSIKKIADGISESFNRIFKK